MFVEKEIFFFSFCQKIPRKSANHSWYFCFDEENREQFDFQTPALLSTWISKLLPLFPLCISLVTVRRDWLRSPWWGSVRCWWWMGSQPGWLCPLGSHILLLVRSTQSTHSPLQECFSPDLMPCHLFQPASHSIPSLVLLCYKSCQCNRFVATEEANLEGFVLTHQNICGEYRWCTGLWFFPALIWSGQRYWWISASSIEFQHNFKKRTPGNWQF